LFLTTSSSATPMSLKNLEIETLYKDLKIKDLELEKAFEELDRRIFHLKTLNDISRNIFSTVEFTSIVDHFLLMIIGNFGVIEGFAMTTNIASGEITHFKAMGYDDEVQAKLRSGGVQLVKCRADNRAIECASIQTDPQEVAPYSMCALPFRVTDECYGILGLGAKLIGEPFSEDDKELLVTLANSLVISLANALSFQDIKKLNADLQTRNDELKAALRKIEILEGIKTNLTKFVPTAVTKMVENWVTTEVQDAQEQDISVLFLDIEGYCKITDEIGATQVNRLIEKYFSVFLDAIFANDGDIVETAGDGLMVLFLSEDKEKNALQAAKTAEMIRKKAHQINSECSAEEKQCLVNVGVCSGKAFVGAAKFESITGSRWAYTTHGNTVNIAARLCGQAKGGEIFLSHGTVNLVRSFFNFESKGNFFLKNIPEKIEVFTIK
jgi:class 3 adenylate cyclase